MEILEGLEPVRRGPYTGAIGWIGPDGAMQTSIAHPHVRRRRAAPDAPRRWRDHLEERPGRRMGRDRHQGARAARARSARWRSGERSRRVDGRRPPGTSGSTAASCRPTAAPVGLRPRLPARRRDLRDAPRPRRPPDRARRARRPAAPLRRRPRHPAARRTSTRPAGRRDRGAPRGRRASTARTATRRSGSRSRAAPFRGRGLLPPDEVVDADDRDPGLAGRRRRRPTTSSAASTSSPRRSGATRRTRWSTLKTTSRADYVYARLEARRAGADDALFLTDRRPPVRGHDRQHLPRPTRARRWPAGARDAVARLRDPARDDPVVAARLGRAGRPPAGRGLASRRPTSPAADEAFLSLERRRDPAGDPLRRRRRSATASPGRGRAGRGRIARR